MADTTDVKNERLPLMVHRDLHKEIKLRAVRLGMEMQEAADAMARLWLKAPEKKAKL